MAESILSMDNVWTGTMYEDFYGLKEKPFSLLPDPGFLYLSHHHRTALNLLEYGLISQAGFIVITGEVGSGKTTLIRRVINSAGKDIVIGNITNTHAASGDLLNWIVAAFELDREADEGVDLYNRFVQFVVSQYAAGRRMVLIVDEAQNIGINLLEELRMLSNINSEKDQLLQLVLVGQPELLETLKRPELRQFAQRISVHHHLVPLDVCETAKYIRHRLRIAGGSPDIFDLQACVAVHYFCGGIPRLINMLCDIALVYGYSEDLEVIDLDTVIDAVQDRSDGGLSPFATLPENLSRSGIRSFIAQSV